MEYWAENQDEIDAINSAYAAYEAEAYHSETASSPEDPPAAGPKDEQSPLFASNPEPLTFEAEPYPIESLPPLLRDTVEEVQEFTQAPLGLVATCALSPLSIAVQGAYDVKRMHGLVGPTGLFLLVIAEPGERKTTTDSLFIEPIREFEREALDQAKQDMARYQMATEAYNARVAGLKDRIRHFQRTNFDGKKTRAIEEAAAELERLKEPEAPKVPRLLYEDATPEALAFGLSRWPSGGVVSSEGGVFLGGHGMNPDAVMRNLSFLNNLWSGEAAVVDRRTKDCFRVDGARLTVSIQVQEFVLREFLARTGRLARGSGWLSRFLIAWPQTTQGTRFIRNEDEEGPFVTLEAYRARILEILKTPLSERQVIEFEPKAQALWVDLYNEVERKLPTELGSVKDIAAKSADNAARLAALFAVLENRQVIDLDSMKRAARLVWWYLSEARRLLGVIDPPQSFRDAEKLENWAMSSKGGKDTLTLRKDTLTLRVAWSDILQSGPSSLRSKSRLEAAVSELERCHRARVVVEGKKRFLVFNPRLLE